MITNLTDQILAEESSGVLNWILEGARMYQQVGLDEPEAVVLAAKAHRESTDSALRFIDEKLDDNILLAQGQMSTNDLHKMYTSWASEHRERALGQKRFVDRILSSGRSYQVQGQIITGISPQPGAGFLGHIQPRLVE
jgi:phage/plasmid-associated DNA primase